MIQFKWRKWLGRQDSNLRMPIPKTGALPLGYAPANGPEDMRIEAVQRLVKLSLARRSAISKSLVNRDSQHVGQRWFKDDRVHAKVGQRLHAKVFDTSHGRS